MSESSTAGESKQHNKRESSFLLEQIYNANCRTEFLKLLEQAHGSNMARLLAELEINSATCLLKVNVMSEIQNEHELLSSASVDYVFQDGKNDIRAPVKINLEQFILQMNQGAAQSFRRKRQRKSIVLVESDNIGRGLLDVRKLLKNDREKYDSILILANVSYSSGDYNRRPSIWAWDASSDEQLEHNLTTTLRIDHFLRKYYPVKPVKVTLMRKLAVYEEQLYELLMHLRNDKSAIAGDEKENQNQKDVVGSIIKRLNGYNRLAFNKNIQCGLDLQLSLSFILCTIFISLIYLN